jgi:hypothetical protein
MVDLRPGVRVRIRAPGSINGRVTGVVTERSADSLSIAMENGVPFRLPLSAISTVDISQGRSGGRGAMKGAMWGAGIGLLSGGFSDGAGENCTGDSCFSRGELLAASVITGGLAGAAIGALVKSESWQRLDVPVRAALLPTRGGRPQWCRSDSDARGDDRFGGTALAV